jgi:hypothetical protein
MAHILLLCLPDIAVITAINPFHRYQGVPRLHAVVARDAPELRRRVQEWIWSVR